MVEISESLQLLFETPIERDGDRYVITIPDELVENGSIAAGQRHRVAIFEGTGSASPAEDTSRSTEPERASTVQTRQPDQQSDESRTEDTQQPPVEEGEVRDVTIDTLGDQGDGIAKVERGFIVIVPETKPGDRATVRITDVKDTVAFAEAIGETTVR